MGLRITRALATALGRDHAGRSTRHPCRPSTRGGHAWRRARRRPESRCCGGCGRTSRLDCPGRPRATSQPPARRATSCQPGLAAAAAGAALPAGASLAARRRLGVLGGSGRSLGVLRACRRSRSCRRRAFDRRALGRGRDLLLFRSRAGHDRLVTAGHGDHAGRQLDRADVDHVADLERRDIDHELGRDVARLRAHAERAHDDAELTAVDRALRLAGELERDIGANFLVRVDREQVDVGDVAAQGVDLEVLDQRVQRARRGCRPRSSG